MKYSYIRFDDKYLPIIPIKLKGKEWVEFKVFVDSGAGYSIFHFDIGEILGIDVEKGIKDYVKIGDGSFIEAFVHKVQVLLAGKKFVAKIGFSRSLGIGFNILGREDVFDRFKICFDEKNRIIEFIPYE